MQDATAPCIPGWDHAWMKGLHARTLLVRFCLHARARLTRFAFLGDTRGITCAGETREKLAVTCPKYRTYHEIQPSTCAGETKFTCACEPKTTCAREAVTLCHGEGDYLDVVESQPTKPPCSTLMNKEQFGSMTRTSLHGRLAISNKAEKRVHAKAGFLRRSVG